MPYINDAQRGAMNNKSLRNNGVTTHNSERYARSVCEIRDRGTRVQSNAFVDDVISIDYNTVTSILLALHYKQPAELNEMSFLPREVLSDMANYARMKTEELIKKLREHDQSYWQHTPRSRHRLK